MGRCLMGIGGDTLRVSEGGTEGAACRRWVEESTPCPLVLLPQQLPTSGRRPAEQPNPSPSVSERRGEAGSSAVYHGAGGERGRSPQKDVPSHWCAAATARRWLATLAVTRLLSLLPVHGHRQRGEAGVVFKWRSRGVELGEAAWQQF